MQVTERRRDLSPSNDVHGFRAPLSKDLLDMIVHHMASTHNRNPAAGHKFLIFALLIARERRRNWHPSIGVSAWETEVVLD
jgi:hypothetical protein